MEPPNFIIHPLDALSHMDPQLEKALNELPRIQETELKGLVEPDATCPICMNTFNAIIAEEELAYAMDSPAVAADTLGVTRLHKTCGHFFCRKDITTWLRTAHTTCPTCRAAIVSRPPSPTTEETRSLLQDAVRQFEGTLADTAVLQGFPNATQFDAAGSDVDFVRAMNAIQTDSANSQEFANILTELIAARMGERPGSAPTSRPEREEYHSMYA
ncbi:hypothetical protein BKA62DRAFT_387850 [Auriculariales sp. MPI-PUGE-AT-0066]|nr:hypothetical protein BKA62DRAFT_387850 [Auriculariales sp. MPI-PUGE-AT-0066]